MQATYTRNPKIIKLLLDHKANVHATDNLKRNALHHFFISLNELDYEEYINKPTTQITRN